MWLSKKLSEDSRIRENETAELGNLTITNADTVAASSSSEARGISFYCPPGISFSPRENQKVLLLRANGNTVCSGVLMETVPSLKPGEIRISSAGGASILLKNDGEVLINGCCSIDKYGNIETGGSVIASGFENLR